MGKTFLILEAFSEMSFPQILKKISSNNDHLTIETMTQPYAKIIFIQHEIHYETVKDHGRGQGL